MFAAAAAGGLLVVAVVVVVAGGGGGPAPVDTPAPDGPASFDPAPAPAPPAAEARPASPAAPAAPAAPASSAASQPAGAPAAAEADEPDQAGSSEDDFFAKLRAESEARMAVIAKEQAAGRAAFDRKFREAVRRWDPAWTAASGGNDPNLPAELVANHLGRANVLLTHPVDRGTPAALERTVAVPEGGRTALVVTAATMNRVSQEDWVLRVLVDGNELGTRTVGRADDRAEWQTFRFELSPYAGRTVRLRLENASGGPRHEWDTEYGVWAEARIETE